MVTLDFYILGIIVYRHAENLVIGKAVATAFLHLVQNVGDAVFNILQRVTIGTDEQIVILGTLF